MNSTGAMSLPRGDTAYRGGRGRGVFGGGEHQHQEPLEQRIDYITIATLGNGLILVIYLSFRAMVSLLLHHQLVVFLLVKRDDSPTKVNTYRIYYHFVNRQCI